MPETRTETLVRTENGFRRPGIEEPHLQLVSENDRFLVVKRPGHRWNNSGIRGMPDYRYECRKMIVFQVLERSKIGLSVRHAIEW